MCAVLSFECVKYKAGVATMQLAPTLWKRLWCHLLLLGAVFNFNHQCHVSIGRQEKANDTLCTLRSQIFPDVWKTAANISCSCFVPQSIASEKGVGWIFLPGCDLTFPKAGQRGKLAWSELIWEETNQPEVVAAGRNQGYRKCIACPLVWQAAHLTFDVQRRHCFWLHGHFACLTMTVTVTSSLKLSPWCFHCHAKCSALYVLFVEQGISCNAAYHDKLRCKALQSLPTECIDVSRVEKITGNSNTSTRKQMTWNMSAWL